MPVVFAYPEVDDAPPDLLEACAPSDLIADWLLTLFPDENGPAWDTTEAYRAPVVTCYARLRQVTGFYRSDAYAEYRARREKDGGKFDQEDARDDAYLEVPAAAAFLDVLSHPHFILGGPLTAEVRAPSADPRLARADQGAGTSLVACALCLCVVLRRVYLLRCWD